MRFPIPMLLAASIVLASTASSQTVSYQVGAFPPASWEEHILAIDPDSWSHSATATATGGNPGDALQLEFSAPRMTPGSHQLIVAWMNGGLAYDPSASGAVERFAFAIDAAGLFSSGISGTFYGYLRPMIQQDGNLFSVGSSSLQIPSSDWTTMSWNWLATDNWITAPGVPVGALPDFSASGAPITFGFRLDVGLTCNAQTGSLCSAPAFGAIVDNFRVDVWAMPSTSVPEPSSLLLLAAGVGVLLLSGRLRKRAA